MEGKWFNTVVLLFWMSTMTWLVVAKVVPPLRRGEPPTYQSMYETERYRPPVGWQMALNGKPLGWAVSRITPMATDMTRVEGFIHFDRIPLEELSPAWMRFLLRTVEPVENIAMDVQSLLEIDYLGHLSSIRSELRLTGVPQSIQIDGQVRANRLRVKVRSGDLKYEGDHYLPSDALVSDELSPQTRLTGLRLGQEWTVPVFSPLRPPNDPIEILQARVESRSPMVWGDRTVGTFQVVYRADSGSALSSSGGPRAKLWVAEDGAVLKQEVKVFGSTLVFTRLSEEKSIELERESRRWRFPRRFGDRQRGQMQTTPGRP